MAKKIALIAADEKCVLEGTLSDIDKAEAAHDAKSTLGRGNRVSWCARQRSLGGEGESLGAR